MEALRNSKHPTKGSEATRCYEKHAVGLNGRVDTLVALIP